MLRFQMLLAGKRGHGPPPWTVAVGVGVRVAVRVAVRVRVGVRDDVGVKVGGVPVTVGVSVGGVPVTVGVAVGVLVGVGVMDRAISIIFDAWARVAVPLGRK